MLLMELIQIEFLSLVVILLTYRNRLCFFGTLYF